MPDKGLMKMSLGRVDSLSVVVHLDVATSQLRVEESLRTVAITSQGKCFLQFLPCCACGEAKVKRQSDQRLPEIIRCWYPSLFCACSEADAQCDEAERGVPASNAFSALAVRPMSNVIRQSVERQPQIIGFADWT